MEVLELRDNPLPPVKTITAFVRSIAPAAGAPITKEVALNTPEVLVSVIVVTALLVSSIFPKGWALSPTLSWNKTAPFTLLNVRSLAPTDLKVFKNDISEFAPTPCKFDASLRRTALLKMISALVPRT